MAIRLTGAQVSKIKEAIVRFEENTRRFDFPSERVPGYVPIHRGIEELVEDILLIATPLPPMWLINEKGDICPINTLPTQNARLSAKDS